MKFTVFFSSTMSDVKRRSPLCKEGWDPPSMGVIPKEGMAMVGPTRGCKISEFPSSCEKIFCKFKFEFEAKKGKKSKRCEDQGSKERK